MQKIAFQAVTQLALARSSAGELGLGKHSSATARLLRRVLLAEESAHLLNIADELFLNCT